VEAGDRIGRIGEQPLVAAIAGVIRGLLPSGYEVRVGQKLGDVDPRGDPVFCHTLSDKTQTLSGAALEIILACFARGPDGG